MNAALFDFPAEKRPGQRGRTAIKGVRLRNFKQMLSLDRLPWKEMEVAGYGGKKRTARIISDDDSRRYGRAIRGPIES